jgi:hypothetical protein
MSLARKGLYLYGALGGVADLDLNTYTPSTYSNLQPFTSISGTLPFHL